MDDIPPTMEQVPQKKKSYESPLLETYGDISTITQAVGSRGMLDGGNMAGMRRTHA